MTMYNIEFQYNIPMWGDIQLDASDVEEAETLALEQLRETSDDDWEDLEITAIKEIKEDMLA